MIKLFHLLVKDPRKTAVFGGLLISMLILKLVFNLDAIDYTAEELEVSDGAAWWVNWFIDLALFLTYFLIGLCLAGTFVGLFIYRMILNQAKAIKFGILIGAASILFLICWMSSTSDLTTMDPKLDFTEGSLKFLGGMVSYTVTLTIIGILGATGSSIFKLIK